MMMSAEKMGDTWSIFGELYKRPKLVIYSCNDAMGEHFH